LTQDTDNGTFTLGCFQIDISKVKISDMKAMRKLLPRSEYKLLKNRKCARMSRSRRKEQTGNLIKMNKKLKEENARLRRQLGLPDIVEEEENEKSMTLDMSHSSDNNDSNGASPANSRHDGLEKQLNR